MHKHVDAYSEFSKRLGSRFAAVWSIAKLTLIGWSGKIGSPFKKKPNTGLPG